MKCSRRNFLASSGALILTTGVAGTSVVSSSDGSVDWLRKAQNTFPQLVILEQENTGVVNVRNRAIAASTFSSQQIESNAVITALSAPAFFTSWAIS